MKPLIISPLLATVLVAPAAHAATYYFGPSGSSSAACTQAAPCALDYNTSGKAFQPGDTIYLLGGTYSGQYIRNGASGNSGAWITFKAVDGQLPILDGGGGVGCGAEPNAAAQYVVFDGIASRNWQSSGFSNGWNTPSSHIQFINCIADGNGVNGIAFYKATGVLIQQSIVAHNGNLQPSWSSGVNLYSAGGSYQDNIVRRNVSFENIDISSHHSDGSGFILDQGSTGALFENNIGFRNGGSCIRLTTSSGSHIVNNTCYHDGLEPSDAQGLPANPGEIYYSDATSKSGTVFQNNLAAASGYNKTQTAFGGQLPTQTTNYAVSANAATPFFVDPAGTNPDFHLTSSATTNIVDKGTGSGAPTQDIGFDARCIKSGSPGGASWWSYTIDYAYIASIGGVARCFNPATRSNTPDIGAYEYNGTTPATGGASGTGGTTSTGGSTAAGGTTARGGTTAAGGSIAMGGTTARGGTTSAGGSTAMGGTTATGGSKATGGTAASSGGTQTNGGMTGTGGTVMPATGGSAGGSKAAGGTTSTVPGTGGVTVAGGSNAGGSLGAGGLVASGGVNAIGGVIAAVGGTNASMGGATGGAANTGGDIGGAGGAGTSGAGNAGDVGGCGCRVAGGSSHSTLAGLGLLSLIAFARRSSARSAFRRAIRGGRATLSKADNIGRSVATQI